MTAISIDNNDNIDIIVAMKIHILVCDGVFDLGLAALTDTVGLANAMAGSLPQAPAHIELTLVGVRRRIRTAQGLTVPVVTARGVPEPDVVLVPAFGEKMPDTLSARLTRPDVPDAVAVLQQCGPLRSPCYSSGPPLARTLVPLAPVVSCLQRVACLMGIVRRRHGGWGRCFGSAIRTSRWTSHA